MSENVPITFTWRALVQDHDWPERSTDEKIPSRVAIMAVAFVLERHSDADGRNVYPSVGTVADLAGVSSATVRKVYQVMRDESFLRKDGQGRHRTVKYRLVYPSLSSQIDSAGSISESKSRQTTNRTESPTADSTPDGLLVTPSATTQPAVSIPKVEVDRDDLERKGLEFLRPFFERGERVSFLEERSLAEKFDDDGLDDNWQSLTRTPILSDLIRFMENLGWTDSPYEEIVSVMSGETSDLIEVKKIMKDHEDRIRYSVGNAMCCFESLYCQWRNEFETGWINDEGDWSDEKLLNFFKFEENHNYISTIVDGMRKKKLVIDESRDRVMAIRANAQKVSVSATNTGSDASIVAKIVETVSEKVVERW